jgi:crotonobetainyl-CoA:carnitine CoA-transferase CaiB-like acyl-CoA transferase
MSAIDRPAKAGCSIADIAAGMYALSNILGALLLRGRTGRGCRIDVSMLESMIEWMSYPLYYAFDGADAPPRTGAEHATIYPYGPFPTGDGKVVMLGIQNDREWVTFCERVLDQPGLAREARFASNTARSAHRDELRAIVAAAFAPLTARQVVERLESARIANARVNDMHEVWAHPQLAARRRWVDVGSPAGDIPALLPPGVPNAFEPRMDPVPALGEHTNAILTELGYGRAEIEALRSARAI